MDNTLPRFDAFPSYVSCIKNYGRPILPPLLSSAQRQEMADFRRQAIIAEARIARRKIQKSSLMDKAKEIMEKIEKSQVNLLEKHTDCDNGSGDHSSAPDNQDPIISANSFLPYADLPSLEKGDNPINIPLSASVQEKQDEDTSVLNCHFSIHGTESCASETEDSCSQSSACDDTSSQATFSMADGDSSIVIPSACDKYPILSISDSFIKSHNQHNNLEESKFSSGCFLLDNSLGIEPNLPLEGDEWEENGDSSSAHKTSDIDETENTSMATVILRSCEELPNDTDSDSMITSATQSTDLEKYFDSPGDCQFSESSERTERACRNGSSVRSVSSDLGSTSTLVNSDVELTPVPCVDILHSPRSGNRCESKESFASNNAKSSLYQEGRQQSGFQTHVRRSSYTLDKPSPALLQAFSSNPCSLLEKQVPQIKISPVSPFHPAEDLDAQADELDDLPCVQNSFPCLVGDQWAYKVTRDFCDNSEPCDELSVKNDTCDKLENLCDPETFDNTNLYGQEPFSSNTSTVLSSLPKPINPSGTSMLESAFETSIGELCSVGTEEMAEFCHSLFPSQRNEMNENFLTQILESLQEFQRGQIEKFKEEQRQQWEKLRLKFQEQDTILLEQLKSLYVSNSSDYTSKDGYHVKLPELSELARPTLEKSADTSHCLMDTEVPSVISTSGCLPHVENRSGAGDNIHEGVTDPLLSRKFDRVSAAVKGYLTRRLMKTERVQGVIQTIKDTLLCAVRFHEETPVKKGLITEQDAYLHQRLISQITAACCELHDIFFKISTKERMLIISQSRELARERKKTDSEDTDSTQKKSVFRRSPRSKTRPALSSATIKYLERKNVRSSSEVKGLTSSPKGKASRTIPKRPASASGRRTVLSPPTSLKSSKCTPYAKSNMSTKGSAKNPKGVRRLTYSRTEG